MVRPLGEWSLDRSQGFAAGIPIVILLTLLISGATQTQSEQVFVKYRGQVSLRPFECTDVHRSSFIKRVCYDRSNEYMLINLNGTYYHYCHIGNRTVTWLLNAESMGRFYNASIKGRFDCRLGREPGYEGSNQ